jgi:hypothetical protein
MLLIDSSDNLNRSKIMKASYTIIRIKTINALVKKILGNNIMQGANIKK